MAWARATSRRVSSRVATAGVTGAPRRVAAKTFRTGLRGMQRADADVAAHGRERQLRDQADADAGGDQALHRLVIVALEGDAGLEAGGVAGADDVAGAGARDRGLHPGLLAQVLEPDLAPAGESVVWRQGEVEGVLEQLEAADAGAESLADALEFVEQGEVELAAAQARRDLLRLALGERHFDPGVAGAEGGDRLRHQGRAGAGEGGDAQSPCLAAGDRGELGLGRFHAAEDALGVG